MVVLHETVLASLLIKVALLPGFHEEAAVVTEDSRFEEFYVGDRTRGVFHVDRFSMVRVGESYLIFNKSLNEESEH